MPKVAYSSEAEQDILDIAYQISVRDRRPLTADRIIDELIEKCQSYARTPLVGTQADHLFEGCHIGRYKRWLIFYRVVEEGIDVVRILDGARDYPSVFR